MQHCKLTDVVIPSGQNVMLYTAQEDNGVFVGFHGEYTSVNE